MNIISKCEKIIENINDEFISSELSNNIGLHAGTSGIALFIAYYERIIHQKKIASQRIIDILEHNIQQIDSGNLQHTICDGLSGFGWLCEHLRKLKILTRNDIEFLDDIDYFLHKKMIIDIKQGNYDFLHGALGVGTYFLSRFDRKEVYIYLEELLSELEKSCQSCENGAIRWISILDNTGKKGYNISLSHGISSIVAFLIRLHQKKFEIDRVDKLITGAIIYILEQKTYIKSDISYFPSLSKESSSKNSHSRLGWCYGDLGISYTLWKAAIILKNDEWHKISLQILYHTKNRNNLQENGIQDAGLCHGSAGIAHVFWNLYQRTQINDFLKAVDYWLNITIQMAKYPDGLAGYKAWRTKEFGGSVKSDSLLEGISGIGLFLLSYLDNKKILWDECLLLT